MDVLSSRLLITPADPAASLDFLIGQGAGAFNRP